MSGNTVRVWDKDFNLVGQVDQGWRVDEPDKIAVPLTSPLGQFIAGSGADGCHLTVDPPSGERWTGHLQSFTAFQESGRDAYLVATFGNDEAFQRQRDRIERMRNLIR